VCEEKYTILSRLHALIYLGVIWCGREDYKKSREYLEKSLKVYKSFKQENNQESYSLRDLLNSVEDYVLESQTVTLESYITHAYYYLAQVEGKAGNSARAAELCHTTLSRQLLSPEFDWMDWARNCATLSQFYLNQDNFMAARYHLAAALTIIEQKNKEEEDKKNVKVAWEEEETGKSVDDSRKSVAGKLAEKLETNGMKGDEDEDEDCLKDETKVAMMGNVSRFCSKYGLTLLEYSHCLMLSQEDGSQPVIEPDVSTPRFENLDVSIMEGTVTDHRVTDFESARSVFLWAQKHTIEAQKYFSLDERCSDHIELTRDLSQMYKHLLSFEEDDDRKCKMHRRRADLLEPLYKELHPDHYLLTIRQILFELGEIFSDLVDLKRKRWQAEQANQKFSKKVNQLTKQAVLYFQTFLDTMKVEGKDPEKYNEDTVRPALLANFYLGRLASKFVVETNSPNELENVGQTYQAYKRIVDYCEKYPEAKGKVSEELEACTEMVRLLPVKMEKIRKNLTLDE